MRPLPRVTAAALACAAATTATASAQTHAPPAARQLLTTQADDARALFVNPAGLARRIEAALGVDLTVDLSSDTPRLSQIGLLMGSRNLAVGWSRGTHPGGAVAILYAVGVGLGDDRLSMGFTHGWYRGGTRDGTWDVALRGRASPVVDLSLVWRRIGSPLIRSDSLREWPATFIPAAGLRLLDGRLNAGLEGEVEADLSDIREIRAGAALSLGPRLSVSLRADLSAALERRGFALAVTWNPPGARTSAVALTSPGAGSLAAAGVTVMSVARPGASRFR